jgi:TldD protein
VTKGVLVDYQTTREQAAWLAPYYHAIGHPVRSHGCAGSGAGRDVTMQHRPNLRLLPGANDASFDALVKDIPKGIAVLQVQADMDQQLLNGSGLPVVMRQITNGRLGPYITNGGILFRTPEFWRNLAALGGPSSERWMGLASGKGQPYQSTRHSVGAVPAIIKDVRVMDVTRKA